VEGESRVGIEKLKSTINVQSSASQRQLDRMLTP
jgi:hypothetical protein